MKFQFLMVRLKGPAQILKFKPVKISIPYGAIKSSFKSMLHCTIADFNSLWCD